MLSTVEEKTWPLGTNMINNLDLDMHNKIENLSSLTTLNINIQTSLHAWEELQHQLLVSAEAIVEACVQQQPSTSQHNP